jgi:septum formation protein
VAEYISKKKADAYRQCMADNELIITADTIVVSNNKILGKPVHADDAHKMLRELSGQAHQVITGVTITTTRFSKSFSSVTDVNFAELSDEEIDYYIENYKPFDKAGAYGIQEWIGCVAVSGMVGSYYNVMGLPIFKLYQELKEIL